MITQPDSRDRRGDTYLYPSKRVRATKMMWTKKMSLKNRCEGPYSSYSCGRAREGKLNN